MSKFKMFLIAFVTAIGVISLQSLAASYGIFSPGGDLSGTWNSQTVTTVNGLARTDDNTLVANGTSWALSAVPNCTDTGGNHLNYTAASNAFSCGTSGSATPGGATTNVQYNNAGAFAGEADFAWDATNNRLDISSGSTAGRLGTLANGAGQAGALTVRPGDSTGANGASMNIVGGLPGSTNNGGSINITGAAGGATSGNAGSVTLGGGAPTDGNGGNITLNGSAGVGTNRDGGSIVLAPGAATGAGTIGAITFSNATATGAQTATFVATNKPGAGTGAPTLWLRVRVSGTTYWVPLFAD